MPLSGLQVTALWHWSPPLQVTAEPPQTPPVQTSLLVQICPSLQALPLALLGLLQTPVLGLQVPTSWHWSLALQVLAVPPLHTPESHFSPVVHAFPSSQVPVLTGLLQMPVLVLQVPALWHWSLAVQTTAAPLVQTPDLQTSPVVHANPSVQALPSALTTFAQPLTGSQTLAMWHWSAVQVAKVPVQLPLLHLSLVVQALPSSHAIVLFVCVQAYAPEHASVVHGLPSSQVASLMHVYKPLAHA